MSSQLCYVGLVVTVPLEAQLSFKIFRPTVEKQSQALLGVFF